MPDQTLEQFYQDFETLPKLISTLALGIADAQSRLDQGYLDSLERLAKIAGELKGSGVDLGAAGFAGLFKDMGPSRYQFTETVVDVRADLRMSTGSEFQIGGSLGLKTPMFAVTVNASYLKRTAADFQASALIHCVINAIPSDSNLMQKLLDAAPKLDPGTLKPNDSGFPILQGFKGVLGVLTVSAPDTLTGKVGGTLSKIEAVGGTPPYTFAIDPAAPKSSVTLNADGTFAGTLKAADPEDVTIKVTDSAKPTANTANRKYTIKVT
jgi:hypothetical protein